MFSRSRKFYRKKKVGRKASSAIATRKRTVRSKKYHVFSETFKSSPITVNQDGSGATPASAQAHSASISSIQQYVSYKNLYKKYRILKLEWTIIPIFGEAEPNQAEYNEGTATVYDTNTWLHYRRAWDPDTVTYPSSELDMLQLNGVKTLLMNGQRRPIKISMKYPTPQITLADATAGVVVDETKNRWLSFTDDTTVMDHGRLYTYAVNRSQGIVTGQGTVIADVYCKVTFAVCDPR